MEGFTEKQKLDHVKKLWKFNINLLVVAHKTVRMYQEVSKDFVIYTDGDFEKCTKSQRKRMFGTVEDVEYKERPKFSATPKWFILIPGRRFFLIWNIIIICLLSYIATILPYRIAFMENQDSLPWTIWDYISDFIFLLDVFFNCITAYERPDESLEVRPGKILGAYAKGWLALDLFACIPFQLIGIIFGINFGGSSGKLLRLARLPRLYKLIKIFRVFKIVKMLQTNEKIRTIINFLQRYSGILRLLKSIMYAFLMIHLIA